jgi:parallel beta-helix repeat protein
MEDNVVAGIGMFGLRLTNCSDGQVKDNEISASFMGVVVTAVNFVSPASIEIQNVQVEGNDITGCPNGAIWVQTVGIAGPARLSEVKVARNDVHGNEFGIFVRDFRFAHSLSDVHIKANRVADIGRRGIGFAGVQNSKIMDNEIEDNGDQGIQLRQGSSSNMVMKNTIVDSGLEGIALLHFGPPPTEPGGDNLIMNNTIVGSGSYGISLTEGVYDNTVKKNKVFGSASGCDLFWDETGQGNCWKNNIGTECPVGLPGC